MNELLKQALINEKKNLFKLMSTMTVEEIYNDAYTLLVYERIHSLLYTDRRFQDDRVINALTSSESTPLLGYLVNYCVQHNVLDLDKIDTVALEAIDEYFK